MTLDDARSSTQEIGLELEATDASGEGRAVFSSRNWTVIEQSPGGGTQVDAKSTVEARIENVRDRESPKESETSEDPPAAASIEQDSSDAESSPMDDRADATEADSPKVEDLARTLAVLDTGIPSPNSETIETYEQLLRDAALKCEEEEYELAGIVIGIVSLALEEGIMTSNADLLTGVETAVPSENAPMNCHEVAAMLFVLME